MSPRPNFRGRLRPALIFELGRIGSEHLPNDLPRDPKLPADRLDRPLLNEIRPADLRNRLHDQHPELGLHVPWKPVWTLIPGVPFGCRSPRKRGPYSTPIHTDLNERKLSARQGLAFDIAEFAQEAPLLGRRT